MGDSNETKLGWTDVEHRDRADQPADSGRASQLVFYGNVDDLSPVRALAARAIVEPQYGAPASQPERSRPAGTPSDPYVPQKLGHTFQIEIPDARAARARSVGEHAARAEQRPHTHDVGERAARAEQRAARAEQHPHTHDGGESRAARAPMPEQPHPHDGGEPRAPMPEQRARPRTRSAAPIEVAEHAHPAAPAVSQTDATRVARAPAVSETDATRVARVPESRDPARLRANMHAPTTSERRALQLAHQQSGRVVATPPAAPGGVDASAPRAPQGGRARAPRASEPPDDAATSQRPSVRASRPRADVLFSAMRDDVEPVPIPDRHCSDRGGADRRACAGSDRAPAHHRAVAEVPADPQTAGAPRPIFDEDAEDQKIASGAKNRPTMAGTRRRRASGPGESPQARTDNVATGPGAGRPTTPSARARTEASERSGSTDVRAEHGSREPSTSAAPRATSTGYSPLSQAYAGEPRAAQVPSGYAGEPRGAQAPGYEQPTPARRSARTSPARAAKPTTAAAAWIDTQATERRPAIATHLAETRIDMREADVEALGEPIEHHEPATTAGNHGAWVQQETGEPSTTHAAWLQQHEPPGNHGARRQPSTTDGNHGAWVQQHEQPPENHGARQQPSTTDGNHGAWLQQHEQPSMTDGARQQPSTIDGNHGAWLQQHEQPSTTDGNHGAWIHQYERTSGEPVLPNAAVPPAPAVVSARGHTPRPAPHQITPPVVASTTPRGRTPQLANIPPTMPHQIAAPVASPTAHGRTPLAPPVVASTTPRGRTPDPQLANIPPTMPHQIAAPEVASPMAHGHTPQLATPVVSTTTARGLANIPPTMPHQIAPASADPAIARGSAPALLPASHGSVQHARDGVPTIASRDRSQVGAHAHGSAIPHAAPARQHARGASLATHGHAATPHAHHAAAGVMQHAAGAVAIAAHGHAAMPHHAAWNAPGSAMPQRSQHAHGTGMPQHAATPMVDYGYGPMPSTHAQAGYPGYVHVPHQGYMPSPAFTPDPAVPAAAPPGRFARGSAPAIEPGVRPIANADATAGAAVRMLFIRRTYLHLFGAIAVFAGLLFLLRTNAFLVETVSQPMTDFAVGGRWNWGIVLLAFMAVSWLADCLASHAKSRAIQYAGLACYVVAEALIFVPLLAIVEWKTQTMIAGGGTDPHIVRDAAIATLSTFGVLTAAVLVMKRDFSFLGAALALASGAAIAAVTISLAFGFQLGIVFSVGMVVLAGGYILFQTSRVLAHHDPDRHVSAALALFSSVALMFWYVIRILMRARG